MEDGWSSGYSGYSFDIPLFISPLAQEASDEWKTIKSKRAIKPPSPTGKGPACQCHITKGRYHGVSDANYNPIFGDYDPSDLDFDFDIPIMMTNLEGGDVPPNTHGARSAIGDGVNVVDQTSIGCEATKRKPEDMIKGYI